MPLQRTIDSGLTEMGCGSEHMIIRRSNAREEAHERPLGSLRVKWVTLEENVLRQREHRDWHQGWAVRHFDNWRVRGTDRREAALAGATHEGETVQRAP